MAVAAAVLTALPLLALHLIISMKKSGVLGLSQKVGSKPSLDFSTRAQEVEAHFVLQRDPDSRQLIANFLGEVPERKPLSWVEAAHCIGVSW